MLAGKSLNKYTILGCDSTHAIAFCKSLNEISKKKLNFFIWDPKKKLSDRVNKEIENSIVCETIDESLEQSKGILILNRFAEDRHNYIEKVKDLKIPIFIDKPITMDLTYAYKINKYLKKKGTPFFSSSAFRVANEIIDLKKKLKKKKILGGSFCCPAQCNDLGNDPRLKNIFFYGVHIVEVIL